MIVKDPLDISVADFNAIKSVVRFNARYIQNGLGQVNLLEVANLAGTAGAVMPESVVDRPAVGGGEEVGNATTGGNATAEAVGGAGEVMTKGQHFTVTELNGQVSRFFLCSLESPWRQNQC